MQPTDHPFLHMYTLRGIHCAWEVSRAIAGQLSESIDLRGPPASLSHGWERMAYRPNRPCLPLIGLPALLLLPALASLAARLALMNESWRERASLI